MSILFQLKNEVCHDSDLVRRLVIEPGINIIRPVYRSDRSNGKKKTSGTYQSAYEGDYVIVYRPSTAHLTFAKVDSEGNLVAVDGESFNYYPLVQSLQPLVTEWLYNPASCPFLPKGVGWDGLNSQVELIKHQRANNILPRNMPAELAKVLKQAINYTPVSVFKHAKSQQRSLNGKILTIPSCDIYIQANAQNEYIRHDYNEDAVVEGGELYIEPDVENGVKYVYIICLTPLAASGSNKLSIEFIELY